MPEVKLNSPLPGYIQCTGIKVEKDTTKADQGGGIQAAGTNSATELSAQNPLDDIGSLRYDNSGWHLRDSGVNGLEMDGPITAGVIYGDGTFITHIRLVVAADNTAALAAGLVAGDSYVVTATGTVAVVT